MRITEKSDKTIVFLPKNIANLSKVHKLSLHSELTNKDYFIENLIDNDNLIDYYSFICDFSEIPDGEYIYLVDEDACGLIILGDVKSKVTNIEYVNDENNKYIVYNND